MTSVKGAKPNTKNNIDKSENIKKTELMHVKTALENIREYDLTSAIHMLQRISNSMALTSTVPPSEQPAPSSNSPLAKTEVKKPPHARVYGNIQFRSTVRHARPGTTLDRVEMRKLSDATFQPVLWVNFIGVAGIQGPLPMIYTERVFRNIRNKDCAFAAFLDIFNHRIIKLTYDLYQWLPGYSTQPPEQSALGQIVLALDGVFLGETIPGAPMNANQDLEGQERLTVAKVRNHLDSGRNKKSDNARYFITYKTLFWRKVRSSAALMQILKNFFQVSVSIFENIRTSVSLQDESISKIGKSLTLGHDIFIGNRVWRNNKIVEITLSDIPGEKYESFNCHTNGENWKHFRKLSTNFIPSSITIRYFVRIQKHCKKQLLLGRNHNLGFNTWVGTGDATNTRVRIYGECLV
ncbi:MAG: type VI secretion system baseplate subunit TssG [Holosporales bacterium]|jgi:type VI secretion system protein ImpH|nr:type VI secretion system baseplate subunit TssG [Holosporales bacterium]